MSGGDGSSKIEEYLLEENSIYYPEAISKDICHKSVGYVQINNVIVIGVNEYGSWVLFLAFPTAKPP